MSKKPLNPNTRPDAYPADVRVDSIRKSNDPDLGAADRHERDIAKLDRANPPEKGGRGK